MTDFEIREQIGRDYALSWLNEIKADNIAFTTDLYECVDVNFTYNGELTPWI